MSELRRRSVKGGMINFITQGINLAIHMVSTVTLARLLSPDDYGVMAMVLSITAFAQLFRDLGLSAAAIQKGSLSEAQMSNLFWINVGMGTLLTASLAAASPLVARFYEKPELTQLTLLLSCTFIINSLGTQHGALMQRNFQFGRRAICGISGALTTLVTSIYMAWSGYGYWSLACGTIAGASVTTTLLFLLSPFRPGLWTRGAGIASMLKFGANVTAFDFINYFSRNLDNILIGRVWGAAPLGLYSRAYQLLMFPIYNLRAPITSVAFPALSSLQGQPERYRSYYVKTSHLLAFLSMPTVSFLAIASDSLVYLALGPKWAEVATLFSILALVSFIQPVSSLRGVVLLSLGLSHRYLVWGIASMVVVSTGFLIGVQWGPRGVAISYCVSVYTLLYPTLSYIFKGTPLRPLDFFRSIFRPATASIAAFTTMWMTAKPALSQSHHLITFIVLGAGMALLYLLFYSLIPGGTKDLSEMLTLLREAALSRVKRTSDK